MREGKLASARRSFIIATLALLIIAALAGAGYAQKPEAEPKDPAGSEEKLDIKWQAGPGKGALKTIGEIGVPDGYRFANHTDTQKLMEATGNPVSGHEAGFLAPDSMEWFVVFDFTDIGYVKDDEKDKLDANAILESIREGNEQSNEERKRRGFPEMKVVGWEQPPHYDPETHNLEWAIRGESEGRAIINYNTRILGRKGVMEAALVVDPDKLTTTLPTFKKLLTGYNYTTGQKYAEYRAGDKVAAYGLVGLVTGGAAVAAAKLGLFGKLWKFLLLFIAKIGKLIVVVIAGIGATLKSLYQKFFGKKDDADNQANPAS